MFGTVGYEVKLEGQFQYKRGVKDVSIDYHITIFILGLISSCNGFVFFLYLGGCSLIIFLHCLLVSTADWLGVYCSLLVPWAILSLFSILFVPCMLYFCIISISVFNKMHPFFQVAFKNHAGLLPGYPSVKKGQVQFHKMLSNLLFTNSEQLLI